MSDDERAIRRLIADRAAAMRQGDAHTIASQYASGATVFTLNPPLRQPADGLRSEPALRAWLEEKGGRVGSEVRDLEVVADGDVAFVHYLERMGSPDDNFAAYSLWFRTTLGLRRLDSRWRIVHEHASTPFYMDSSMRAAVELTPDQQ